MFKYILTSLRGYRLSYLKSDIVAGIIVAAMTIPVAMGYAGVAGLPPIYGLYASMLPVLGYILFASSKQLIFGADASASAITGSCLAAMGIAAGSGESIPAAALLSLFAGIFLVVFALCRLGRFSEYISMPVMSGFISGTAFSIIVGQIPKILGIAGNGNDFLGNLSAIAKQAGNINLPSLLFGGVTVLLILLGKKFLPKIPVALITMVLGTVLVAALQLDKSGIAVVGEIPRGLPPLSLPDIFGAGNLSIYIGPGFMIAVVIFADSLMSANTFAVKSGDTLEPNREVFAFGISNLCASVSCCAPTSASVSRTAASEQFHGRTQMVSAVAVAITALVVSFLSGGLYYMPQPVLGAIVLAALVGVVEIPVIRHLLSRSRSEAIIWLAAAVGVLLVGTLFGVLVGMILSFIDVIMRITAPPQAYLGRIAGRDGYFDLGAHKSAEPIPGVVIYRFSARLIFANIGLFKAGVLKGVEEMHPHTVIIDASGINSIDMTAADELKDLLRELEGRHIHCIFAGQIEALNRQLVSLGVYQPGESKHLKKTIDDALHTKFVSAANVK